MAQTFNTKLTTVAGYYLKQLNAKVTQTSLEKDLQENSYYPSLLSLSDTLNRYNIPNSGFNVPSESFDQLQAPFVALINLPSVGSDFVLVTSVTDDSVSYLYDNKKQQIIKKEEFLTGFKNIVLYAEVDENSGEASYESSLIEEQKQKTGKILWSITMVSVLLFFIFLNVTQAAQLAFATIAIVKLIGLAAAVLLLTYEIDKSNAFVKNICTAGVKTDCDAILSSGASKIWGISWAEIGFFYFSGTTIGLLMPGLPFDYKLCWLAIGNALAAPYIMFSIYYQWRVIKQWCPLCLTIQVTLAAELVWAILNFWLPIHSLSALTAGGVMRVIEVFSIVLIPILSWYGLKSVFKKAKDYDLNVKAYKRLQYNPDIFNSLLIQQPKAADGWDALGITIGNPMATDTIIKVCNPYCGPCAKAHPKLEEAIKQNNNIKLKTIFTSSNNGHDRGAVVVKHLLAIAAKGDSDKAKRALDDWYLANKKDYNDFATLYPMNGELKQQDAMIEAMSEWCDQAEITHTPTFFVNGYRLPENYEVEELKYILQ